MLLHRSRVRALPPAAGDTVRMLVPLSAAVAALAIGYAVPLVSPLLIALGLGAALGNTPLGGHRLMAGQQRVAKLLLRVGVVLLGLRLPLQDVADIGVAGIAVIGLTVLATFVLTCRLGDRLGLERGLVTLIAAGFSICGASAIAAVESGIRRRDEDVALSIAMVTVFGTSMIVALPLLADRLGLSELQAGVWAGASIHEVAQVVAAASAAGAGAVAIATTIKLGRVSLLAVAYVAAQRRERAADPHGGRGEGGAALVPWFVVGFAAAVGVRSTGLLGAGVLGVADVATTVLLAAAMFGLGLMMRLGSLLPVPWRVLVLAAASTATAATVSLGLTLALF